MSEAELYEALVLWPAYAELCEHFDRDPHTSDPGDLTGKVAAYGHERSAAVIYAGTPAVDLDDAVHVLGELLELAAAARRPRFAREIGSEFYAELTQELRA